jgi:hypothetical protein
LEVKRVSLVAKFDSLPPLAGLRLSLLPLAVSVFDALLAEHDTSAQGGDVVHVPDDIAFENVLFDLAFDPQKQIVAVADVDGYTYW